MQLELLDTTDLDFRTAIAAENLVQARNAIAQFLPDKSGNKLRAYKTLLVCAIELGRLSIALEVAPFCGHRFTKDDFRDCMKKAIRAGNLTETLLCKERLHENFTWQEVYGLRSSMIEKRIPLPYVLTQLGMLSPLNPLREALLKIVDLHVPMWKLPPDEQLLIHVLKIVK